MLVGVVGIYCSLKLLKGVTKSSKKPLEWWITYQLVAILNQAYIYVVTLNITEESLDTRYYVKLLAVVAIVHIAHEFGFLVVIMKLHVSFNSGPANGQQNQTGNHQVLSRHADKPPSYDEIVVTVL